MRLLLFAALFCVPAFSQQVAFTSRLQVGSPIVLSSPQSSKTYGFESVEVWNDGELPLRALRLRVTFRMGSADEITDDRLVFVDLEPRERKRIVIDLGHQEGLKQKARSKGQELGLAILTIGSAEFQDGTVWEDGEPAEGTPGVPEQFDAPNKRFGVPVK